MSSAIRYVTSLYEYGSRVLCLARLWETSLLWDERGTMFLPAVSSSGAQNRSADFEQARVALIAAARRLRAPSLCAFDLLLADEG
jgi:hypothetical protein